MSPRSILAHDAQHIAALEGGKVLYDALQCRSHVGSASWSRARFGPGGRRLTLLEDPSIPRRMLAPTRTDLMSIDLFVYLFLIGGGSAPDGFTIEALYTKHLDDLRSALRHSAAHEEAGSHEHVLA